MKKNLVLFVLMLVPAISAMDRAHEVSPASSPFPSGKFNEIQSTYLAAKSEYDKAWEEENQRQKARIRKENAPLVERREREINEERKKCEQLFKKLEELLSDAALKTEIARKIAHHKTIELFISEAASAVFFLHPRLEEQFKKECEDKLRDARLAHTDLLCSLVREGALLNKVVISCERKIGELLLQACQTTTSTKEKAEIYLKVANNYRDSSWCSTHYENYLKEQALLYYELIVHYQVDSEVSRPMRNEALFELAYLLCKKDEFDADVLMKKVASNVSPQDKAEIYFAIAEAYNEQCKSEPAFFYYDAILNLEDGLCNEIPRSLRNQTLYKAALLLIELYELNWKDLTNGSEEISACQRVLSMLEEMTKSSKVDEMTNDDKESYWHALYERAFLYKRLNRFHEALVLYWEIAMVGNNAYKNQAECDFWEIMRKMHAKGSIKPEFLTKFLGLLASGQESTNGSIK